MKKNFTIPDNPEHRELMEFLVEIYKACNKIGIRPIIYGSLAIAIYSRNLGMQINDVDMLIHEKDFGSIINMLDEMQIQYRYETESHMLQVLRDGMKIEFDSIEFWQNDLDIESIEILHQGTEMAVLVFDSLKKVYLKASLKSTSNPEGNRKKYEELERLFPS